MNRSYLLMGFVTVAAAVALLLWKTGGSSSKSSTGEDADSAKRATDSRAGGPGANSGRPGVPAQLAGAPAQGPTARALDAGRYPPWSRPLEGRGRVAMNSNAGAERVGAIEARPRAGAGAEESEPSEPAEAARPSYIFRADKYGIAGGDVVNLTLEAYDGDRASPEARVPVQIHAGYVTAKPEPGVSAQKVATLAFNDRGRDGDVAAGDLIFSSRFVAEKSSIRVSPGLYLPVVEFAIEGGSLTLARLAFSYTPGAMVPARFTGKFSDAQVDGSLLVTAGLDVDRPGDFVIDGTLFDSAGDPIGRANFLGALGPGAIDVPLRFYGLMFRERDVDGPYVLRHVRGHRVATGDTPDREDMPMYVGSYRTADYAASSFAGEEWSGDGANLSGP